MSNIKKSKSWINDLKFKLVEVERISSFDSFNFPNGGIVSFAEARGLDIYKFDDLYEGKIQEYANLKLDDGYRLANLITGEKQKFGLSHQEFIKIK
tara:strand:+ start:1020 stop:1307 length:288 start_codon:yes stop_codon:yes gene_type:complete